MAAIFQDSFDHIQTAHLSMKWNKILYGAYGQPTIISDGFTNQGLRVYANSGIFATFDNVSTCIAGFLLRPITLPTSAVNCSFFAFGDTITRQVYLTVNQSGSVRIYNGSDSLLGVSSISISQNEWTHLELKVTPSPTSGSGELRINGRLAFSGSGLVTAVTGNAQINTVGLYNDGGGSPTPVFDYDSVVVLETTSGRWKDFLGPTKIDALLVNADGAIGQSDHTAATNWQSMTGQFPNLDTSYGLFDSGELTLLGFQDLLKSDGAIFSAAMYANMRKRKGGVRTTQFVSRPGTADFLGISGTINYTYSPLFYITESPMYHKVIYDENPATNGTFTVESINEFQGGIKRIS